MLVLRKEIKIGIGAGLAILGIAGTYGLLSSVSGGSKDATAQATTESSDHDPLAGAVTGLPPKEGEDAPKVTPPSVARTNLDSPGNDPFAESKRTDGAKVDVWSSALSSGKIGDVSNASATAAPKASDNTVPTYRAPTPSATLGDTKFVRPTATAEKAAIPNTTPARQFAAAGGSKYAIQNGDTFSTIAAKFYGNKKYASVLVKANPDVNPARMKIGHEITVPPKESVASVGGSVETNDAKLSAPIDATRQYRVAPGDTLSHIAGRLYGKSTMWQAIYEANKAAIGPDEARLKVGMLLDLPEKPVR